MRRSLIRAVPLLFVVACGGKEDTTAETSAPTTSPTDSEPTETERPEGASQTVTVFDDAYVYFGAENYRQIDVTVDLPDSSATYSAITGHFKLSCPESGLCDHWDRYGNLGVVLDAGTDTEQFIEIDRFITAYRVGFSWDADLTAMRPLLTDTVTFRFHRHLGRPRAHRRRERVLRDGRAARTRGPLRRWLSPCWNRSSKYEGPATDEEAAPNPR